jgi:hypothetical protein
MQYAADWLLGRPHPESPDALTVDVHLIGNLYLTARVCIRGCRSGLKPRIWLHGRKSEIRAFERMQALVSQEARLPPTNQAITARDARWVSVASFMCAAASASEPSPSIVFPCRGLWLGSTSTPPDAAATHVGGAWKGWGTRQRLIGPKRSGPLG